MEELIGKAARDLVGSEYAIALTGAGISTESGIPDFRGANGTWTKDPEAERKAYESYHRFLGDPKGYWEEALDGQAWFLQEREAMPNPGHYALAELEKIGILKWVITQNGDGLHQKAGSKNVIEYHGGLLKLRCVSCGSRFDRDEFDFESLRKEGKLPPRCRKCNGALKSDVVYFQEPIPSDVVHQSLVQAQKCDLMLVCGTSAVVYPFADLPRIARQRTVEKKRRTDAGLYSVERAPSVRIIEVNAEPTPLTSNETSDYLIRGKTGEILPRIVEEVKRSRSANMKP